MGFDSTLALFEAIDSVGSAAATAAPYAAAATTIAGATGMLSRKPIMPPSPVPSQQQQDQSQQQVEQNAMRRQSIAGGMTSTVGTPGGQAGSMLNPSTMSGKTLLGQ